MDERALEKINKTIRIAEAILAFLETWAEQLSENQGLLTPKRKLINLDRITVIEYNGLIESIKGIIEKEL